MPARNARVLLIQDWDAKSNPLTARPAREPCEVGVRETSDTLVIAAADPDHPSFGCQYKAKWTYFGDAFFNVALRHAKSLKDAFVVARALVQKRELRGHFEPSNPLMAGGANVRPLLIARDPKRTGSHQGGRFELRRWLLQISRSQNGG